MGEPMPGAKESLEALERAGHYLMIHSCNRPKVIADWMTYYNIPFHHIWTESGKPVADFYLDDRSVKFTSWVALGTDTRTW